MIVFLAIFSWLFNFIIPTVLIMMAPFVLIEFIIWIKQVCILEYYKIKNKEK